MLSGCVHVTTHETKTVDLPASPALTTQRFGDLNARSLLYRPSKLPLDDFFSRLSRGEFRDAFREVDFNYEPSNVGNEGLRRMIDEGYLPLYLEITNQGSTAVEVNAQKFALEGGHHLEPTVPENELPSIFKKFNPEAAAANAANVGIVVVSSVAILVALAYVAAACRSDNCATNLVSATGAEATHGKSRVFNDWTKTTRVEFRQYLFPATQTLEPGASARGLLFFHVENMTGLKNYRLTLN
jgi:hypothetical protein